MFIGSTPEFIPTFRLYDAYNTEIKVKVKTDQNKFDISDFFIRIAKIILRSKRDKKNLSKGLFQVLDFSGSFYDLTLFFDRLQNDSLGQCMFTRLS